MAAPFSLGSVDRHRSDLQIHVAIVVGIKNYLERCFWNVE